MHDEEIFKCIYSQKDLSIYESLMFFKGRLSWFQYISLKRARFRVKMFVLAEAESGYVHNTTVHTEKITIFDKMHENYEVATKSVMDVH